MSTILDEKSTKSYIEPKSQLHIDHAAQQFSNEIFAKHGHLENGEKLKLSVAALQGYLLDHKRDPNAASCGAAEWVENLQAEQEDRAKKREEKKAQRAGSQMTCGVTERLGEIPLSPVSAKVRQRLRIQSS